MNRVLRISIFLRNFLIKQHPYFSCCASCGEIKTPLGNRLCSSLTFPYTIDVVLLCTDTPAKEELVPLQKPIISQIHQYCPWVGKIIVISKHSFAPPMPHDKAFTVIYLEESELIPKNSEEEVEKYLHTLSSLSEYYLVVPHTIQLKNITHPLDFYTPNGIPLLHNTSLHGVPCNISPTSLIHAYTKESVRAFIQSQHGSSIADKKSPFHQSYSQWAHENSYAILASS